MSKKIENPERKASFIDNVLVVCRVCLKSSNEQIVSLFELFHNNPVFQHINEIADLKIYEGDGFPDKICKNCLVELDITLNFKEKCENSNKLLHENYTHSNIPCNIPIDALSIKKEDDDNNENNFEYSPDEIKPETPQQTNCENEEQYEMVHVTLPRISSVQCHDCNQIFKSKCKLRVHWKEKHLLESLTCMTCKRIFKSVKPFRRHLREIIKKPCLDTKSINIEGVGKNRVFHCSHCHYSSRELQALKQHSVVHTGLKSYKCHLCSSTFTQSKGLISHKETVHQLIKVEITCQYCGKYVKGRNNVYRHLRSHKANTYQCDICKLVLKTRDILIKHLRRHVTNSYPCETCPESFLSEGSLYNHRRTKHSKVKVRYTCDLCNYEMQSKFKFLKHKLKHTNSNVACSKCGKFFFNQGKLKKHFKSHFGSHGCPLCDKKFLTKDYLRNHFKRIHKTKVQQTNSQEIKQNSGLELKSETSNNE